MIPWNPNTYLSRFNWSLDTMEMIPNFVVGTVSTGDPMSCDVKTFPGTMNDNLASVYVRSYKSSAYTKIVLE